MVITVRDLDGSVYLASGCFGCVEIDDRDLALSGNVPLWKLRGRNVYVACEYHYPSTDILRHDKDLFAKEITPQSILSHTVPRMRELLNERGLISPKGNWGNEMLIVADGRIFSIDYFFSVQEIDEWDVRQDVWYNEEEYMRGALHYTEGLTAKTRILECMKTVGISGRLNNFPLTVVNTRTNKKEIWWSYEDGLKKVGAK